MPSQQALRTMSESCRASKSQWASESCRTRRSALRGVVHNALPRIDVAQLTGSMARELEREERMPSAIIAAIALVTLL
jgi:hypothetical protein